MSWRADQVYTLPQAEIIQHFKRYPSLARRLFCIADLDGIRSEWTRNMMLTDPSRRHALPSGGLLAIAPVVYRTGYDQDSAGHPFWEEVMDIEPDKWSMMEMHRDVVEGLPLHLDFTLGQLNLFSCLHWLSVRTSTPFFYYKCTMWGGLIEDELALVFERDGAVRSFIHDVKSDSAFEYRDGALHETGSTPLQLGLAALGLQLPSWFFALHEGSLDWRRYQV